MSKPQTTDLSAMSATAGAVLLLIIVLAFAGGIGLQYLTKQRTEPAST